LLSVKPYIVKEAAWTISNIAAGTIEQIQQVIEAGLVPMLIHVIKHVSVEFSVSVNANPVFLLIVILYLWRQCLTISLNYLLFNRATFVLRRRHVGPLQILLQEETFNTWFIYASKELFQHSVTCSLLKIGALLWW